MKVIDLLNKIANGEDVPAKIKFRNNIFRYTGCSYYCDAMCTTLFNIYNFSILNEKVEIIKDKEMCHKCGKYPCEYNQTYCEFCLGISEEDKKIEKIGVNHLQTIKKWKRAKVLGNKINEIIDKINKLEDK